MNSPIELFADTEFAPFPKIPRYSRECVVTEKIDGTNAQIVVHPDGTVRAASRRRWITPDSDNFGFAAWVEANRDDLRRLGPGRHYGEWWGLGIQRGYGLFERRFSLFNVHRWNDETAPKCCHVVPLIHIGPFGTATVETAMDRLRLHGSAAAPGWKEPEGVVIYHQASGHLYKKLLVDDDKPKGNPFNAE